MTDMSSLWNYSAGGSATGFASFQFYSDAGRAGEIRHTASRTAFCYQGVEKTPWNENGTFIRNHHPSAPCERMRESFHSRRYLT